MKTPDNFVYLVFWPDIRVMKVGVAAHKKRWRMFCNRGANLVGLMQFDDCSSAFAFEDACHIVLSNVCRGAFTSNTEAAPYLGGQGGGYKECFQVPGDLMETELMEFIDNQLEEFACS